MRGTVQVLTVLALGACGGGNGDASNELKLTASDPAPGGLGAGGGDRFGSSVALAHDRAVIGAPHRDGATELDAGGAYVYERNAEGAWIEVTTLSAADEAEAARFGSSIALDGDRAIIGASGRPDATSLYNGGAYVYERDSVGSWMEVSILTASDGASGDHFGESVALDGDRAIIGAGYRDDPANADDGAGSGKAYVYERDAAGTWIEVAQLTSSTSVRFGGFGQSVALDDDRAIVGASRSAGGAHVYERDAGGVWTEVATLIGSGGVENDGFGIAVELDGDRAIVGARGGNYGEGYDFDAGSVYVYERDAGGNWAEVAVLTASDAEDPPPDAYFDGLPEFGQSIALEGDRVIVGAPYRSSSSGRSVGGAYVYERGATGAWTERSILSSSDGARGDLFGGAVALSGDQAIVGARLDDGGLGAAYVFTLATPSLKAIALSDRRIELVESR